MIVQDERRLKILARLKQERGGKMPLLDICETREDFELIKSMYRAGWLDKQKRGGVGYLRINSRGRMIYFCLVKICGRE